MSNQVLRICLVSVILCLLAAGWQSVALPESAAPESITPRGVLLNLGTQKDSDRTFPGEPWPLPDRPVANMPGLRNISIAAQASSVIQFSSPNYSITEDCTAVTITVNRIGDTSGAASVDYFTADVTASERSDYTTALGTLQFAPGETSKTFAVLISDDSYVEGPETFNVTLSNPSGASLGAPETATVTVNDNPTAPGANAIDNTQNFVGQHYHDFLNRQADAAGLAFWTSEIISCGLNQSCIEIKQINVSAAYFVSIEFQQTGYLVERTYKAAYGDAIGSSATGGSHTLPVPIARYREFLQDAQRISQGVIVGQSGWETVLQNNKQAFANEFAQRSRFTTALPTTLTPTEFVDRLNQNAGNVLSAAERTTAISLFAGATNTNSATARAQALRQVVEDQDFQTAEFNRAFVLMQYFGYLRRNPNDAPDSDYAGYEFWLTKLNQFNGNYLNAEMVKAFISSTEYRSRFGPANPSPTPTSTPTPSPTPTPGQGLTPAQRAAALGAVRAQFESLSNSGAGKDDVNQQLLNFILSRPEFAEAGVSTDSCVWATYTDGVQLIVINNLDPRAVPTPASQPEVTRTTAPELTPQNVPGSTSARLIWALGPAFTDNPIPELRLWLNDQNYTQPANQGVADVTAFKNVGGDGVFFLGAHGGLVNGRFAVSTAEFENPDKENPEGTGSYDDDLKFRRLVYLTALWDVDADGRQRTTTTYGITSLFVRKYWGDFAPNSFVFIDTCSGANPGASDFQDAIREKKASVYAGWTAPARYFAKGARLVFDRLLGANKVYPESDGFKQRPFDYLQVEGDLPHHVPSDPEFQAELKFLTFTNGFRTLAPSIAHMFTLEYPSPQFPSSLLEIFGTFGEDQGQDNRSVSVGGKPCAVLEWSSVFIACSLPVSGEGSAGSVVVTVRGHRSNVATLSLWKGDFVHTVDGAGSQKQTVTYHLHFRADIRAFRSSIHKPPTFLPLSEVPDFVATEDSSVSYSCGGSQTFTFPGPPPGSCTESWSGSDSFPRGLPLASSGFVLNGFIHSEAVIVLSLSLAASGLIVTTDCTSGFHDQRRDGLFSPDVGPTTPYFGINLDENATILGNTLSGDGLGGHHTLQWNNIQTDYPPDPDSAR
jgi:hypothetical protein